MKNKLFQGLVWAVGLSGIGVLVLVIVFYLGKPEPTVDYTAVFNRPAVNAFDNEKAWTVYRDLWIKYGFGLGGKFDDRAICLRNEGEDETIRIVGPSDGPAWLAATQRLSEIEELLEGFRVGGVRPVLGVPVYVDKTQYDAADRAALFPNPAHETSFSGTPLTDTLFCLEFAHLEPMLRTARLLIADSRWAIEQRDCERATRNIAALLGIAQQVSEAKIYVSSIRGHHILTMTMDLIEECVHSEANFNNQQLDRIYDAIARVRIDEMVGTAGERAMFMDIVQRVYSDDGQGDGRITAAGLKLVQYHASLSEDICRPETNWSFESAVQESFAPSSLFYLATRKQLTEKAEELFKLIDKSIRAADSEDDRDALENALHDLPSSYMLIRSYFPAFHFVREATVRSRVDVQSALAALAVLRFQRQHGHLPETLDELVGPFLESLPLDPLGDPLRYRRRGSGFVIYSIGPDGVDDGGEMLSAANGEAPSEYQMQSLSPWPDRDLPTGQAYTGDWILWPRHSKQ